MRCKYNLNLDMNEFMAEFYRNYESLFAMEDAGADMDAYLGERMGMMYEFDDLFDNKRFLDFLREFARLRGDGIDTSFEQIAYMTTLKGMQRGAKKTAKAA